MVCPTLDVVQSAFEAYSKIDARAARFQAPKPQTTGAIASQGSPDGLLIPVLPRLVHDPRDRNCRSSDDHGCDRQHSQAAKHDCHGK